MCPVPLLQEEAIPVVVHHHGSSKLGTRASQMSQARVRPGYIGC